ncbi:MAG: hypothetical protein FH748_00665 [Balneolaceae bacterium]|nr:hypothetical protein [Balneolaceae bacterium]
MNNTKDKNSSLQDIAEIVELLDNSSKQIIGIMEKQIDAVIASDASRIEELSEVHTSLSERYREHEKQFIEELSALFDEKEQEEEGVRLVALKNLFPNWATEIDKWHRKLTNNTKQLQRKHNQILQLLEFAMNRNAKMMHSLYSIHDEKNAHYVSDGKRSGISTGVAVNQEI